LLKFFTAVLDVDARIANNTPASLVADNKKAESGGAMSLSRSQCQALLMFVTSSLSFAWMVSSSAAHLRKNNRFPLHHRAGKDLVHVRQFAGSSYSDTLTELFNVTPKGQRNVDNDVTQARFSHFSSRFRSFGLQDRVKVIHVAGTKGKGSTVEYINSALTGCGYKVGVFTSPHLHTARERIKIGKQLINKDDFTKLAHISLADMKPLGWPVFFDFLLDVALQYFGQQQVDYVILETGIGGKYDSTNFVNAAAAAVITSISLDHQAILGDTVEEIAAQKAGIIKKHGHVFTSASQADGVLRVIQGKCDAQQAFLHKVPADRYADDI
jgi:folylpolyglutamate synthase/dihydropteroate synthase